MFDLQGLIIARGWTTQTSQFVHDALTAKSPIVVDAAKYSWSGIADVVGEAATEQIRIALEANGLGWAVPQLGGAGLVLSDARVQSALTALAAGGVPGCDTLKNRVVQQRSLWNSLTPDDEPSLETVATVLGGAVVAVAKTSAIAAGKTAMRTRWSEFEAAVSAWSGAGEAPAY